MKQRGYRVRKSHSWKVLKLGFSTTWEIFKYANSLLPLVASESLRMRSSNLWLNKLCRWFQRPSGVRCPALSHYALPGTLFLKEPQNSTSCWETELRRGGRGWKRFTLLLIELFRLSRPTCIVLLSFWLVLKVNGNHWVGGLWAIFICLVFSISLY